MPILLNKKIVKTFFLFTLITICSVQNSFSQETCIPENQWFSPSTGQISPFDEYLSHMPNKGIILLGEHHENAAHHQWQLNVLSALYKKESNMAIGLEMFPQYLQPVLDDWIDNKIDKEAFIQQSQWNEIWAYEFSDYLPLFEFAQKNHIPLIAINVQKTLLQMVRKVGWENIPKDHRQGISNPATPSKNYVRQLAASFQRHFEPGTKINKKSFLKFIEQQLLWDRAMAQGLAKNTSKYPLIVGLLGSWHIINGFGVPHQLKDLEQDKITSLIPWDEHLDCQSISDQFADAIYGTANQ